MRMWLKWGLFCLFYNNFVFIQSRKHHLTIEDDSRNVIVLSSFGFYIKGTLSINLTSFTHPHAGKEMQYGFTLGNSRNDGAMTYLNNDLGHCVLNHKDYHTSDKSISFVAFVFNEQKRRLDIIRFGNALKNLSIFSDDLSYYTKMTDKFSVQRVLKKRAVNEGVFNNITSTSTQPNVSTEISLNSSTLNDDNKIYKYSLMKKSFSMGTSDYLPITINSLGQISTSIFVVVNELQQEGLYSLAFHSCYEKNNAHPNPNMAENIKAGTYNFTIDITENNDGNYLSAGEIPLPVLYFTMSFFFFVGAICWAHILRQRRGEKVFKIHYLMLLLVCLKSISLMFHGINFHFIAVYGYHIEAWAILYYITHLLKGAFLFITIILIGSGWAFIKHVLTDKDKKIFMMVIPLQIFVNVAQIIIEESEEGDRRYVAWKEIFTLLDLVCCGAILFPVVWSIRHLQQASRTDGKAISSLEKLKLFRHFYIMIVCYVYFTRIIVYLLQITVPFKYQWLDEFFRELATFAFFILTGYIFRPVNHNPYLSIPLDDDLYSRSCTVPGLLENVNLTTHGKHFLNALEKKEKKKKIKMARAHKAKLLKAFGLKRVSTPEPNEKIDATNLLVSSDESTFLEDESFSSSRSGRITPAADDILNEIQYGGQRGEGRDEEDEIFVRSQHKTFQPEL